ncbi:universal stress protein, partial [Acinetobacter baumannii]
PRPYLSAHGIGADWRRIAAAPSAEIGALRQAVAAAQPDLLVLGAGRGGWLRRLIAPRRLQALLESSTGPVLLTA